MTTSSDVVREFIAAVQAKDLDRAVSMLADDVEYDNVPMGAVHGPTAVRDLLASFLAEAQVVDWVIHHQVATDDVVMNERTDRFRFGQTWLEVPVAGIWRVADGRITLWRDYFDMEMAVGNKERPASFVATFGTASTS